MTTVNQGKKVSFLDTVGIPQDISDVIGLLSPYDVPLLQTLGPCRDAVKGTKHEWIDDELVPTTDTLHVAITATDAGACTVHNGKYFLVDDVIKIDDELLLVTAVNTSTNVLTVTQGFAGTTAATHLIDSTVERIGNARPEGSLAGEFRSVAKTADYNYTQIFDFAVSVSGTREAIAERGIGSAYAYELGKKIKERAIDVEKALIHGVRSEDTTNMRRTMGGLLAYLAGAQVVDASAAKVTQANLDSILADIWRAGGEDGLLVMNADQGMVIDALYADRIRVAPSQDTVGGSIKTIENRFGRFQILMDRWVPRNVIMVLDKSRIGVGPLQGRNWSHTYLGRTGDFVKGHGVAELTMEFRQPKAHGLIKNLSL